MFSFRVHTKTLFGIILGVPFLLLIIHRGSNNLNDYNGYTVVYTDSSSVAAKLVDSSSISTADGSAEKVTSLSNSDSLISSALTDSNGNPISTLDSDKSQKSCVCDNSPIQSSSNLQSRISTNARFVPNEALHDPNRKIIFLITPTYTRPTQMADMTRLSQTLNLVPDVFWIVVEDSHNKSKVVENLLQRTNIPYVHLLGPRPPTHMDKRSGRGVSNRLKALKWLRQNYGNTTQKGVIYFADDDNAYDVRVFEEMRDTQIVSMFPVGLISTLGLSTPIVSQKTGKIIGFHDPFIARRKFAVDMAGFAVNLQFFLQCKKATMPYKVGYEEDYFLKSLDVKIWQLEPKAKNCTEILVWHTKTKPADNPKLSLMHKVTKYNETNLPMLYESVLES